MTTPPPLAALFLARMLRLGPLRLTAYGASATVGVVLAMALSGRSARHLKISPDAAWDAGLFAMISCFVTSRLLLVLQDPRAFARFPLLVLSLPSLTLEGAMLAALPVWLYLRHKHLPVLTMLDVFSPSGALLAAALEFGRWLDGSQPGMPIGFLRQGGHWDLHALHLYPVAALGTLIALVLAVLLFQALRRFDAGRLAALGLGLGGATAFALNMLSLPNDPIGAGLLEPGEVAALLACCGGAFLWCFSPLAAAEKWREPRESAHDFSPASGQAGEYTLDASKEAR